MGTTNLSTYIQDDVLKNYEEDNFGHTHIADAVVDSILNTKPPFIIGIFGGWGSGKSSLLGLINSKLPKSKTVTVTIDAWRYTSAENLRRAFLIHVAKELSPEVLDELRRQLYTSEEKVLPQTPSILNKKNDDSFWKHLKGFAKTALNIFGVFLGLSLFFIMLLAIIYSIITIISITKLQNFTIDSFISNFDFKGMLEKYLDLAFIPLLLSLIDYFRLNIIQPPVTIMQERLDAEELFSEYFDRVVDLSTPQNKRLVIFVDNLDRLTDEKMVEALESLKTYINNDKCIFVVACDDTVVRSVINSSNKVYKVSESDRVDGRAGEHYLDKFFQQTFRLPVYMRLYLHDFAVENFKTTQLCYKLRTQEIDIRNLISIILPSDISSPRKVKRLLNEFIALYEIVKRREAEKDGQLRPGLLTGNVEFLGKFSTIRTEYPDFYQQLVNDPSILSKITGALLEGSTNFDKYFEKNSLVQSSEEFMSMIKKERESLISYLRKTQTIMVEDIEPYIWLSQDTMSLGLQRDHYIQLRSSLSNADVAHVKALINSSDITAEYRRRIIIVASRLVESRLVGIEQHNGVKILSKLLSTFDESIRPEIAHIAVKLIPQWPIENYTADELFNVIRWAKSGGADTQKEKIITRIIARLQNPQNRQETFESILINDIVLRENHIKLIQQDLDEILDSKTPSTEASTDISPEDNAAKIDNQKFAEWLVSQAKVFAENDKVIEEFFSTSLLSYTVRRILQEIPGSPAISFDEDILGQEIHKLFDILASNVGRDTRNDYFWNQILRLFENSNDIPVLQYCFELVKNMIDVFPQSLVDQAIQCILDNVKYGNQPEDSWDFSTISPDSFLELIILLRKKKGRPLEKATKESIIQTIPPLLPAKPLGEPLLRFCEKFALEFGEPDCGAIIDIIEISQNSYFSDENLGLSILFTTINIDILLSPGIRNSVVGKIDNIITTNDQNKLVISYNYLSKIIEVETYIEIVKSHANVWLSLFRNEDQGLVEIKIRIYDLLENHNIVTADDIVNVILPNSPFGGELENIRIVLGELEKIKARISNDLGGFIFQTIITTIDGYGIEKIRALSLIANWIDLVDENFRTIFGSTVYSLFNGLPKECFHVLTNGWKGLDEAQIEEQIVQFFGEERPNDDEFYRLRAASTIEGLSKIDNNNVSSTIQEIWDRLILQGCAAETFMQVAKTILPLENLILIRTNAINSVRENRASEKSEAELKLLSSTIREDMREIMPAVDLFVNLFGGSQADVEMALKYVLPCLRPLNIRNEHKHKIAEAMADAALRIPSNKINDDIHDRADKLGLMWFSYRKYWKGH